MGRTLAVCAGNRGSTAPPLDFSTLPTIGRERQANSNLRQTQVVCWKGRFLSDSRCEANDLTIRQGFPKLPE